MIYKCLICNKEFEYIPQENGSPKNNLMIKFKKHLKEDHNINIEEYIIKCYYNGVYPTCKCGCGKNLKFNQKNCLFTENHGFSKYVSCTHVIPSRESIEKMKNTVRSKWNSISPEEHCIKLGTTKDDVISSYNDFIQFKDSFNNIKIKLCLDKRTILKLWKELNLIDNIENFERIIKRHQTCKFTNNISQEIENILNNKLNNISDYLSNLKFKISLKELIHKLELDGQITTTQLYNFLEKNLENRSLLKQFKMSSISNLERDFLYVLKFYFPHASFEQQFKIIDQNNNCCRYYDIKMGKNLLIEIDGTYFHSSNEAKENDIYKERLAIKNGFNIIRISEDDIKNIKNIEKIKEIYETKKC